MIKYLIETLALAEEYEIPTHFEHRVDARSTRIIYGLLRQLQPTSVLEIGTSHGGLACAIQSALSKNGTPFVFVTSEMEAGLRNEAKVNLETMCGQIPVLIGKIEDNLDKVPRMIDCLFIDTNHDLENCKWYLENILPRVKKGAPVWIHDWGRIFL